MNDDTRTKLEDILIALGNDDIGTARRALFTLLDEASSTHSEGQR